MRIIGIIWLRIRTLKKIIILIIPIPFKFNFPISYISI